MAKETYKAARERLLKEFAALGYVIKPNLVRPQIVIDKDRTIYFRAQAIYLNDLSMWADIRGASTAQVLAKVW